MMLNIVWYMCAYGCTDVMMILCTMWILYFTICALQRVAACCSASQCMAVCCSASQSDAVCCLHLTVHTCNMDSRLTSMCVRMCVYACTRTREWVQVGAILVHSTYMCVCVGERVRVDVFVCISVCVCTWMCVTGWVGGWVCVCVYMCVCVGGWVGVCVCVQVWVPCWFSTESWLLTVLPLPQLLAAVMHMCMYRSRMSW